MAVSSRVLAVRRNIDVAPPGAVELFGALFGAVANDGLPHILAPFAGQQPATMPGYRFRVSRFRAEWQTIDVTVPPPLRVSVLVNNQAGLGLPSLANVTLLPIAPGTPALELTAAGEIPPGGIVTVTATNTGAVNPQYVGVYLYGWAFPISSHDGEAYGL